MKASRLLSILAALPQDWRADAEPQALQRAAGLYGANA